MVNFLRKKDSPVKVYILKSRKLDFFRINPVGVMTRGFKRLVKNGILEKNAEKPKENPNFFFTPGFIINWAESRFNDGNYHIGFTVSVKSISKRATKRNLVRRRLKYAFNKNLRNYNIDGYDIVVTSRSEILNMPYDKLEANVKRALKHIETKVHPEN